MDETRKTSGDDATLAGTTDSATLAGTTDSASAETSPHPNDVTLPAHYQPGPLLGVGGMGEVLLCKDWRVGREVALKQMRPESRESPRAYRRFAREAVLQARLEHPSIVPVYDVALESADRAWFTMKRIRGRSLEEVLAALAGDDGPTRAVYSQRKLLTAFVQLCLAIDYAHQNGVVHRDIKPANVMLGDFGEVNVLDWGIAKVLAEGPEGDLAATDEDETQDGILIGTPGYMSPEQARGANDAVDARSDVYALGAILYELLTLERLHPTSSAIRMLSSTMEGVDARPSARGHEVAPELEAIVVRATHVDPTQRFASGRELAAQIERYLDGDRDLERRRELAAEHVARATALLATDAVTARSEATRELGRAVALDPAHTEAVELLGKLFLEAPDALPEEARRELAETRYAGHRRAARAAAMRYLFWCAFIPLTFMMGVREWPTAIAIIALIGVCVVDAYRISRLRSLSVRHGVELMVASSIAIALVSSLFGPFVVIPGLAATNTMFFAMHAPRRYRGWILLAGVASIAVAYAVDALGLVPPAYVFGPDGMTMVARVVDLPQGATTLVLAVTTISTVIVSGMMAGRLRDSLIGAERRLFAQAWHLRQLLPPPAHGRLIAAPTERAPS